MPISIAFWILMLFWIFLDWKSTYPYPAGMAPYYVGRSLLLVVLLFLLGLHDFGWPIHGG